MGILEQKAIAVDRSFSGGTDLDSSVAFTIQYIGEEADGEVALVASTSATFIHGDNGSESGDTGIGSAGVVDISAAANDTVGEFSDTVNATTNWRLVLKGAVRDDAMANILAKTSATAKLNGGLDFYFDGGDGIYSVAITGNEFKNLSSNPGYDDGKYDDKGCINGLAYVTATVTETGDATIKVIEASDSSTTSTWKELYSVAIADSTAQTIGNSASPYNEMVYASDENKRLIVRITAGTSLDSLVAFNLRGCTVDLRRGRVIS